MADKRCFVQFPHPGKEHRPGLRGPLCAGGVPVEFAAGDGGGGHGRAPRQGRRRNYILQAPVQAGCRPVASKSPPSLNVCRNTRFRLTGLFCH